MELTEHAAKQLEVLPRSLHEEFPEAPVALIRHEVDERAHDLVVQARFDDYVPLLVRKTVRERLRNTRGRRSRS